MPENAATKAATYTTPWDRILGALIMGYERAAKANGGLKLVNFDELIDALKQATEIRNAICHGSWRAPDEHGACKLHFVNRKLEIFDTPVDVAFLQQLRGHVAELCVAVVNSVTMMGYQFPGSSGPGKPVW